MKSTVAALSLVVVLAAWASWMFRHDTVLHTTSNGVFLSVFDRWDQKMTVCHVTKRSGDFVTKDCTEIGERETAF